MIMRKIFVVFLFLVLTVILIFITRNKLAVFYNNRGVVLYEKRSFKDAILCFKKALIILPESGLTHFNLANAYRDSNLKSLAIIEYQKCIQLTPQYSKAYKAIAKIYLQQKMYPDALAQIKKRLTLDPADNAMKELLAQTYFEAVSDYSSKALDEFLSGNKKYAYELLNNAIMLKNDSAYLHYLLGYFYYSDNKFNEAKTELEKVIRIDPQFQLLNKLSGDIYFESGNYYQAIQQYKLALALTPNDYILYNNIAITLVRLGRYQEAIPYIEKAYELAPLNPNVLYSLASIYRDNDMTDQALSEYAKLSDYPNVYNDKAAIYESQGRMREASLEYNKQIQYCNRKLSANPCDALILNDLAIAYIGIKEYNKAEMTINKAISLAPDYKQNYIVLANIQKNLGEYNDASRTLGKAGQLPDNPGLKIINSDVARIKNTICSFIKEEPFVELDKIYLKNGRMLEGVIKSKNAEKVVLEIKTGASTGEMTLYIGAIKSIVISGSDK